MIIQCAADKKKSYLCATRLNRGAYTGENLWKNEQRAGRVQLGVGNKIGFTQTESRYLKSWIADSNKEAMQKAMTQGYNHP
jgi:hypothetical protein